MKKQLVFQVGIVSRGKGTCRSAVDAAAYILGEKWVSAYDGNTYDYAEKASEVVYTTICAPEGAHACASQPYTLMHAIEYAEKKKNAQLVRTVYFALPPELPLEQHRMLLNDFVMQAFVSKGMIALCAIHHKDGNPNAHIVLTMRRMLSDGSFLPKSKDIAMLDEQGERIIGKDGKVKTRKVCLTDWDGRGNGELWRKLCAQTINRYYSLAGLDIGVEHRSPKRQGLCQLSPLYINPAEYEAEQHGEQTDVGDLNRWIASENMRRANYEVRKQAIDKVVEAYVQKMKQLGSRQQHQSPQRRAIQQLWTDLHCVQQQFGTQAVTATPTPPSSQHTAPSSRRERVPTREME